LAGEITEIQTLMDEIPAITDREDKAAAIQQAEQKLRGANKTKKTFKMETRLVTDSQTRRTYEKRIMRLSEDLSSLKADLSALKQDFQRESIMGDADDEGYMPTEERWPESRRSVAGGCQ
jgi:ABC-type phosphate transport system auxiliary subunit